jgi:hypothetical protein
MGLVWYVNLCTCGITRVNVSVGIEAVRCRQFLGRCNDNHAVHEPRIPLWYRAKGLNSQPLASVIGVPWW